MLLTFDLRSGFRLPVFFLVVFDSLSVVPQTEGWQVFAIIAVTMLLSLDVLCPPFFFRGYFLLSSRSEPRDDDVTVCCR